MRIAITGSSGFIGGELVNYFLTKGDEVWMLQRTRPSLTPVGARYFPYDLDDNSAVPDLKGVDALVHAAYIPYAAKSGFSNANVKGTMALYNRCLEQGVHFTFLSSMSAHPEALSEYGKHKFELEQLLDKNKCLILKPGLVVGKQGLFSRIRATVQRTSLIFLPGRGRQPVQTIFIEDLCSAIDKTIHDKRTGIYCLATTQVYTMKGLFETIAKREKKRLFFVPVPYWMAKAGISLVELLHLPFPVSRENLLGLMQLKAYDTTADLNQLGVKLNKLETTNDRL